MLYPLASVMEKVADLAVTFASLDHLKHLLHDEFINWTINTHAGRQFSDERSRI